MTIAKPGVTPPKDVQAACRRGLALVAEHGAKGVTKAVQARAEAIAKGESVSPKAIKRIQAYHAKRSTDGLSDKPLDDDTPILLWGGEAGRRWSNKEAERLEKAPPAAAPQTEEKENPEVEEDDGAPEKIVIEPPADEPPAPKSAKKLPRKKAPSGGSRPLETAKKHLPEREAPDADAHAIYASLAKKTKEFSDASRDILQSYLGRRR